MKKKLKRGELVDFARYIDEPADKIRAWHRRGKLNDFIKNGRIEKESAAAEIYNRIAPKQQQAQNKRWEKQPEMQPETEAEVQDYLNETIGDLAQLSIFELQRRNELEKLLIQQIKRRKEAGELIEAEAVEREGFEFARAVRDQFTAIPDRLAAVLAAETDQFTVKQLMVHEINHVLEYVSKTLSEKGGKG